MATDSRWTLGKRKRWQITAELVTCSSLHIGSSEEIHIKGIEHEGEPVAINAVIKGCDVEGRESFPIIPGSSLKGNLLQWLAGREVDANLLEAVFGKKYDGREDDEKKKQGAGGRAEFHDARLYTPLTGKQNYPFWKEKRQTWVMASTAIGRHTGSALHRHLHYTEAVPPGVVFQAVISGVMNKAEVNLLLAALQGCRAEETSICLGAGDADDMGRVQLCGAIEARYMDSKSINDWLKELESKPFEDIAMAMNDADSTQLLDEKEVQSRAASVLESASGFSDQDLHLTVKLPFDGPFLVSDPVQKEKSDPDQPDRVPLRDNEGKPLLPASSVRGALRSHAERIVRTLGGHCCDTEKPCKPVQKQGDVAERCIVCQVFGAAGWKTCLRIRDFTCVHGGGKKRQDFVAIDRFHGGGKDGAKFAVQHSESPCFQGTIEVTSRAEDAGKGLLALVLRDLREGDITFGFGANKGYGHLLTEDKAVQVKNLEQLNPHISVFRDHVTGATGEYPSADAPEPQPKVQGCKKISTGTSGSETKKPDRNQFHNPYHFIPVKSPIPEDISTWLPKDKLSGSRHSHALYRQETESGSQLYHGRIICRLETETPLFIGAEGGKRDTSNSTEPANVKNYCLNGELAIPATSLRGMISSLAEAASNSAMRVLDDKRLSRRAEMRESLPALGRLVKTEEGLRLQPLSLPPLSCQQNGQVHNVPNEWRRVFTAPSLKVYVDGYFFDDNKAKYRSGSFLEKERPASFSATNEEFWYIKLGQKQWNDSRVTDNPRIKTINTDRGEIYFLLGHQVSKENSPISHKKYKELPLKEKQAYTKGILRVLGIDNREKDIPDGKHHEIFLPLPDGQENQVTLDVSEALEKFHQLADERAITDKKEGRLPFEPKDRKRDKVTLKKSGEISTLRLRENDIVFFKIDKQSVVTDLAVSSIWREEIPGTIFDYFRSIGSGAENLLPFNPKREHISPAELLFGFVEDLTGKEKSGKEEDEQKALAFAGKVRVSAGVLPADAPDESGLLEQNRITLKALSTPKPPSPSLYFTRREGVNGSDAISKKDLSASKHRAMGRKYYLHALRRKDDPTAVQQLDKQGYRADGKNCDSEDCGYPWKSLDPEKRPEMKVRVRPITKGTSFYFHLDFSNLTKWELGLLCFALRPDNKFRHKLGMGKPIGLGTVRIDLAGLHLINRQQRYAEDETEAGRYNQGGWTDPNLQDELVKAGYDVPESDSALAPKECREHFCKTVDPDILQALRLLGDPENVRGPVHYPQILGDRNGNSADIEEENFNWFVDNDRAHHECLTPLDRESGELPLLNRRQKVNP
jgi:CRISPR-associated protein (TIGR03986 family)